MLQPFVNENQWTATVSTKPWTTYVFYVTARNGIGASSPSDISSSACHTPQAVPARNPDRICIFLGSSGSLSIKWQVLPLY